MSSQHDLKDYLEHVAYLMRADIIRMTTKAGSGHPTTALSSADLVAALFFYAMGYDPHNYHHPENDRFILSSGHASPVLYAAWKQAGVLSDEDIMGYRSFDSVLEGHPTLRFSHTEAATGSLGMGLSVGAGMALFAKRFKRSYKTYVLMGDSEIAEGSIWEAAELSSFYKLDNLIGIVNCNRLGQTTETMHGHHLQRWADKFDAFGWKTYEIDGHDMQQVMGALEKAQEDDDPVMILAKTIKGYGVDQVEDKEGFHGKPFKPADLSNILDGLKAKFEQAANYVAPEESLVAKDRFWSWHDEFGANSETQDERQGATCVGSEVKEPHFEIGEEIATRKAYGLALTALGRVCDRIVSLDAEVKNSTYAELFEDAFPERFVQCFVAEQNMVSMGVGFKRRGAIPFISTFGAFFSRAHDQIRMAAIGSSSLRLVGSHAGVSIGQDGPSQMALEDIALMRCLPNSVVLYPSDAVSTHRLVEQMSEYDQGISYLRTTRMATPVIYDLATSFTIGGCQILRQDKKDVACIIAAGITIHEALKAHKILQNEGIQIAVIDAYSIKPLDVDTIKKVMNACNKKVITVEDHYLQGGLGEAVTYALRDTECAINCLAVRELPRSGSPEELLAFAGIDAASIIKAVKSMMV